nr:hypothetical protein [Tanacetum cinerariifolium]
APGPSGAGLPQEERQRDCYQREDRQAHLGAGRASPGADAAAEDDGRAAKADAGLC